MTAHCIVPDAKVRDYLLNPDHKDGASKAKFFAGVGFTRKEFAKLSAALEEHFNSAARRKQVSGKFGEKLVLEGPMQTPTGQAIAVRSVWALKDGFFVLATAYPI